MSLNVKNDFPRLKNDPKWIYLDSAATAHKPKMVVDALDAFYLHDYATVNRTVYRAGLKATDAYVNARVKIANFIGAHEDEIIFTSGTTESINLVSYTFPLAEGDEVIISEMEHHSNIVPWQFLCERAHAILKVIPIVDGALDLEAFAKLLTPRTKLVAVAHIANSTGVMHPINEIIKLSHQFGARVLIDGAQAVSHFRIDVHALDADFYVFSGHKMYGPTGIGILYGKREVLEKLPPFLGGGDMIEKVTLKQSTFQRPPLKFEAGTPKIAQVIGLGAAVDYLEQVRLNEIYAHEMRLHDEALAMLKQIEGVHILGNQASKGPILTFTVDGIHPLDLATLLDLKGVALRSGHLCAQPTMDHYKITSALRISFGVYNQSEELKRLFEFIYSSIDGIVRRDKKA